MEQPSEALERLDEATLVLRRVLVDDVARERLIQTLLDKRTFQPQNIGERQYRDETNAVVRQNLEALLSCSGLLKFQEELSGN